MRNHRHQMKKTISLFNWIEPELLMECKFREVTERMGDMADYLIEQGETSDALGEITSEPLSCDKCGREIELDEDAVLRYHIGVPRLLCPECAEKKDEEDFDD